MDAVTSPTFTLVHEYSGGRLPLYHFDFYRLEDVDALRTIGFDEYIFGDGVSVIEWADKFQHAHSAASALDQARVLSPAALVTLTWLCASLLSLWERIEVREHLR